MTPEEIFNKKFWWVLQEIKKALLIQDYAEIIVIDINFAKLISNDPDSPLIEDIRHLLRNQLELRLKVLEIVERYSKNWDDAIRFILEVDRERFDEVYKKYKTEIEQEKGFLIRVKDRDIFINNYIIARPQSAGSNYDFFEYVRKHPNKKIERKNLDIILRDELGDKTFFKILNALGFKKKRKKAFFYKVSSNTLFYRGDRINLKQLEEIGISLKTFIEELEAANAKFNAT